MENKKMYFWGIDILRIISMHLIIILHIFFHGGVLERLNGLQYFLGCFLYTIAYLGVDLFAIVSGFVGFSNDFNKKIIRKRWSKFLVLWIQVVLYSLIISLVFSLVMDINFKTNIIKSFFPVSLETYWYFTAYFWLVALMPCLDYVIQKIDGIYYFVFLIVGYIILLFSHTINGMFSILLLVYLYCVGAIIRKSQIYNNINRLKHIVTIIILLIFSWGWKMFFGLIHLDSISNFVLRYDSPLIIIASTFLVIVFAKIRINNNIIKLISIFSKSSFSVYLLNDHPLVREYIISKAHNIVLKDSGFLMICLIILLAVVFYLFVVLVDNIRIILFNLCKAKNICDKIIDLCIKIINKISLVLKKIYMYFIC